MLGGYEKKDMKNKKSKSIKIRILNIKFSEEEVLLEQSLRF
jgi:hypothetical protein